MRGSPIGSLAFNANSLIAGGDIVIFLVGASVALVLIITIVWTLAKIFAEAIREHNGD